MQQANGIDEIQARLERNQGVLTVTMQQLRDAHGAERLGSIVRSEITEDLAHRGIGHYPSELPAYQEQQVRLFTIGSAVAQIIDAAFTIGQENDEKLRLATGNTAVEILRQVRELVRV